MAFKLGTVAALVLAAAVVSSSVAVAKECGGG